MDSIVLIENDKLKKENEKLKKENKKLKKKLKGTKKDIQKLIELSTFDDFIDLCDSLNTQFGEIIGACSDFSSLCGDIACSEDEYNEIASKYTHNKKDTSNVDNKDDPFGSSSFDSFGSSSFDSCNNGFFQQEFCLKSSENNTDELDKLKKENKKLKKKLKKLKREIPDTVTVDLAKYQK
jgi:cell division protein FtsB